MLTIGISNMETYFKFFNSNPAFSLSAWTPLAPCRGDTKHLESLQHLLPHLALRSEARMMRSRRTRRRKSVESSTDCSAGSERPV